MRSRIARGTDRHQERGAGTARRCGAAANNAAQPAQVEPGAAVERVEPLAGTAAHEEVTGHADAVQLAARSGARPRA